MVTLLITSFLILAGITYVVYLWQRPAHGKEAEFSLPPPRSGGLFDDQDLNQPPPRELTDRNQFAETTREALLARATAGDKEALNEAHAIEDRQLYDEVLNALVKVANSDQRLLALVSYITRSNDHLRVNKSLAEKFIESWKSAPDRKTTAKMLHIAARADDANIYQAAIETAYQFWRDRRITDISADELRQLIESEFWVLAPPVRNSGAGFVLKRKLAQLRRQLVAASKTVTSDE
jgi:hypothetical protein